VSATIQPCSRIKAMPARDLGFELGNAPVKCLDIRCDHT
jgi:hypothetical protein